MSPGKVSDEGSEVRNIIERECVCRLAFVVAMRPCTQTKLLIVRHQVVKTDM